MCRGVIPPQLVAGEEWGRRFEEGRRGFCGVGDGGDLFLSRPWGGKAPGPPTIGGQAAPEAGRLKMAARNGENQSRFITPRPGAHRTGAGKSRVAAFGMTVVRGGFMSEPFEAQDELKVRPHKAKSEKRKAKSEKRKLRSG